MAKELKKAGLQISVVHTAHFTKKPEYYKSSKFPPFTFWDSASDLAVTGTELSQPSQISEL